MTFQYLNNSDFIKKHNNELCDDPFLTIYCNIESLLLGRYSSIADILKFHNTPNIIDPSFILHLDTFNTHKFSYFKHIYKYFLCYLLHVMNIPKSIR